MIELERQDTEAFVQKNRNIMKKNKYGINTNYDPNVEEIAVI